MAKLYFAANTHLGRKYPFFPFLRKTYFSLQKTYFRQNIDHQLYSPYPFITLVVIDIFILYYSFLFYCAIFISMD